MVTSRTVITCKSEYCKTYAEELNVTGRLALLCIVCTGYAVEFTVHRFKSCGPTSIHFRSKSSLDVKVWMTQLVLGTSVWEPAGFQSEPRSIIPVELLVPQCAFNVRYHVLLVVEARGPHLQFGKPPTLLFIVMVTVRNHSYRRQNSFMSSLMVARYICSF